jgi:hypothetical protein
MGAGQVQVLADHLDQEASRLDVHLPVFAVHLERHAQLGHRDDLLADPEVHGPARAGVHVWVSQAR